MFQITSNQGIALVAAIIPVIVAFSAYLYRILESKLPAKKQVLLQTLTTQAVHMAEQVTGTGDGAGKKALASAAITEALKSLGVKVAPGLINTAIEATVYSINQQVPHLVINPVDSSTNSG